MLSAPHRLCLVGQRALLMLLALWLVACGGRQEVKTLPGMADLKENRLVILLHGYISESGAITPLFDLLNREGVPASWVNPLATGRMHYHTHSFDFSRFTRVGSDHNIGVEDLAKAFERFYHSLPLSCPVCAERHDRPVRVTLIARSFGGIIAREFLLREADRGHLPGEEVPGEREHHIGWEVNRVVTLATPFFGSFKTLFSRGFLSIVINGAIRTVLMGFVNPESGGVFGNVIDAQARALRYGSIFLWRQHIRWRALMDRLAEEGTPPPRWLVMAAVGHRDPARYGDAVTRFSSANLAPNTPKAPVETFIADIRHGQFFRGDERGRRARELELSSRALTRFIEQGTLESDPAQAIVPWGIVDKGGVRGAFPLNKNGQADAAPGAPVHQIIYMQPGLTGDAVDSDAARDLRHKKGRLTALLSADFGDAWLRFYDGLPGGDEPPRVLRLRRALSLFRNGLEHSRSWSDLVSETERDADGQEVPVVLAMATLQSHLITIPDLTPTGPYLLDMSIDVPGTPRAMPIPRSAVLVRIEGQEASSAPENTDIHSIPLNISPHQTNLIHVYLDGARLRTLYEGVREIDLREVRLEPASKIMP